MSTNDTVASHGRPAGRDERWPNGVFKYNRRDLSYAEMFEMKREEGDFFAVFRDRLGEVRAQYATQNDYGAIVVEAVRQARIASGKESTVEDIYFVLGTTIITRYMDYEPTDFLHLLDHNLKEIFDLRGLALWCVENADMLVSRGEQACLADDASEEELDEAYDSVSAAA